MIETRLIIKFDYEEGRDHFINIMTTLAINTPSIYDWEIEDIEKEE